MKKVLIKILFFTALSSSVFASKNNFQFQIDHYHTSRQSGQTLDVNVRYGMKDNIDYGQYPDYREIRKLVLTYLEPTADLPVNTFWEVIAAKIGDELMAKYPFSGVSIQLITYANEKGRISEPGHHGPIYTIGDVIPFNQSLPPKLN